MGIMILTPPAEPLSETLTIGLTATDKTAVKNAAAADGLSMSAWGRRIIERELANR